MVDPALVGGAITGAAIISAAAYSYFSGNDASVDTDGDGEAELEFEGNNGVVPDCNDDADDPAYVEHSTEDEESPVPDEVREIEDMATVKGIGDTRADALVEAGYTSAEDLYVAADDELTGVDGIGAYTVEQIREDIGSVEGNDGGESTEEAEADSQDSSDQDSTSEQSSSSDEEGDENDGSDSGETTDSTGNESDDEA